MKRIAQGNSRESVIEELRYNGYERVADSVADRSSETK